MKTKTITRSLFFLCSFFLVLFLGALAYGQTVDSITVTPTTPSTDDDIEIVVTGTKTNTCYDVTATAALDTCGVRVNFVMTRRSNCSSFPSVPVGWSSPEAHVTPLAEGNYTIFAELRDSEGALLDSMTTSFFVIDYADITDVQILRVRSSLLSNLSVDETLTLMIDAVGPEGTTLEYRFYYRYGSPDWEGNSWVRVQDWGQSNSTE